MILILSSEDDRSTSDVMDWLFYYEIPFIRINESTKIIDFYVDTSISKTVFQITFEINSQTIKINSNDIFGYWYRRGNIILRRGNIEHSNSYTYYNVNNYINRECSTTSFFIHNFLRSIEGIGSYLDNSINKLVVLEIAKKLGLSVPKTLVTDNKANLLNFFYKNKRIIQKAQSPAGYYDLSKENYLSFYTREIFLDEIENSSPYFESSLFQELLEKKYELRIFYLNGELFTTAIFSQEDKQTEIDFRKYNWEKPNRTSVYNLPESINVKTCRLMNYLGLKSGSIDMVVTTKNDYVFLEVNPVGQFSQVSLPGNFNLEKKIADELKEIYFKRYISNNQ